MTKMIERIAWIIAVVLVSGAAFYAGQQIGFKDGQQSRMQAAQQFFAQRGGGQANANQSGGQSGEQPGDQPTGGFAGQEVARGQVESVDGTTIMLSTPDGARQTLEVTDNVMVRRQVEGSISDIKPGEQITAFGTRDGETFQATTVQIGTMRMGRPPNP
jgi:hypothetical protein